MTDRRALSQKRRAELVLAQNGKCAGPCGEKLRSGFIEFDHIQALIHGGDNEADNWRALCVPCHRAKTKKDVHGRAHADRIALGGKQRKGRPMDGGRNSPWKKLMSGEVVRR